MNAVEKAESLGATISGGINWTWANSFTQETAQEFLAWLDEHDYEHRGMYPNRELGWGVRFRRK